MDISVTASRLIDRAIFLEEGGAIVIPCPSYKAMEILRVRLYKLRQQLQGKHRGLALSLDITRKVSNGKYTLFITKDAVIPGVFIVEGGEAKPFDDRVEELELPETLSEVETEIEVEPKEELEEPPLPEEDFDAIASEIEKSQGLATEEALLPKKEVG